jgi:hypothetical protein
VAATDAVLWVGVLSAMWSLLSKCTLLQLMFQSQYIAEKHVMTGSKAACCL